jgi:ferredoxin
MRATTCSSSIPTSASNADLSRSWPNITQKKEPPGDAKSWDGVPNKFAEHFSADPGQGD